jgi:hypothetical protein
MRRGKVVRNGLPVGMGGLRIPGRRFAHYVLFNVVLAARREPLDFPYICGQGSSPLLLRALRRLSKRNAGMGIILEMSNWPGHINPSTSREKILSALNRFSRSRLRHIVDRILTFSREFIILGILTMLSHNEVDVSRIAVASQRRSGGLLRMADRLGTIRNCDCIVQRKKRRIERTMDYAGLISGSPALGGMARA